MIKRYDFTKPRAFHETAVALGSFDGMHLGHAALMASLARSSRRRGLMALAYMFNVHPQNALLGNGSVKLLTDDAQKLEALGRTAVETACFDMFDRAFAAMDPEEFARRVIRGRLGARLVAVGYDYRFGAGAAAGARELAELGSRLGFDVEAMEPYMIGGAGGFAAKSTAIRDMLAQGDVQGAAAVLGRLYAIRGTVVSGNRLGRTIGAPTANTLAGPLRAMPKAGVYITSVFAGGAMRRAVTNVGPKPTVGGIVEDAAETHIIGYDGSLYGNEIEVRFHARLRDSFRFAEVSALAAQIRRDVAAARAYPCRQDLPMAVDSDRITP